MLYREAGQFKTSYSADQQIFPIAQDRWVFWSFMAFMFLVVPFIANDYWFEVILIPVLVWSVAAIGLNILTGYCGQVSLGTGGFMALGAFMSYYLATSVPGLHFIVVFVLAGLITAAVGILFGLPSLRIKGFYLAVATLAAHFFLLWFVNGAWFVPASGTIDGVPMALLPFGLSDVLGTSTQSSLMTRYWVALALTAILALAAKNMVRGRVGRAWMAIRDMDIAAELIGIRPLHTKLLAFAISSFYIGFAGAMMLFLMTGTASTENFDILLVSFPVLSMIIDGGLGSILGPFLGAAFITVMPVVLKNGPNLIGFQISSVTAEHLQFVVYGALIMFFLIVEPLGLARLWSIAKEKLRLWPFPY